MEFSDREQAGRLLAEKLGRYRGAPNTLVLGIPQGGIPVASALSRALELPLDVIISCKLMATADPGVTLGAVAETGNIRFNPELPGSVRCACDVAGELRRAHTELEWRREVFRGGRPLPDLSGRRVIVVDDGVITGCTITAALEGLRALRPARLAAAVPIGPLSSLGPLRRLVDELIALEAPAEFESLGLYYRDFRPVPAPELVKRLSWRRGAGGSRRRSP